jgi:GNAT superfamily N-acetyltransferase
VKRLIKSVAHGLLGDYSIYHIYADPDLSDVLTSAPGGELDCRVVAQSQVEASAEPLLLQQVGYFGEGAHAYGCWCDGRLAGVCFYWFGDRYRTRNFWPLDAGEAKLVQIVVVPEARGRGIASELIARSRAAMRTRGFCRMYARIWHSNVPSLRAFERAGWERIATVLEVNPLRLSKPWRIMAPHRARAAAGRITSG